MKSLAFFILNLALIQVEWISTRAENLWFDETIVDCIVGVEKVDVGVIREFTELQIVTDLVHLPLSEIVKRPLVPENNGQYNRYLTCSWQKYGYQDKYGNIDYDKIEKVLREALEQEVGNTGPGANLSKVTAKRIVDNCRNITGITPGLKVVRTQNCIFQQLKHLDKSDSF